MNRYLLLLGALLGFGALFAIWFSEDGWPAFGGFQVFREPQATLLHRMRQRARQKANAAANAENITASTLAAGASASVSTTTNNIATSATTASMAGDTATSTTRASEATFASTEALASPSLSASPSLFSSSPSNTAPAAVPLLPGFDLMGGLPANFAGFTTAAPTATTTTTAETTMLTTPAAVPGGTAACVVGGIRSLTFPRIYQSIADLAQRVGPTKVFLVVHWTQGRGETGQVKMSPDPEALRRAAEALQAVHVEVYDDSTCAELKAAMPNEPCCGDEILGGYYQLAWIQRCFNAVSDYEAKQNTRFDLFMKLRPDILYLNAAAVPPRQHLLAAEVTVPLKNGIHPGDWFFITSRTGLNWFLSAYVDIRNRCSGQLKCRSEPSGPGRPVCVRDAIFSAPEYSPWFHQDPPGYFDRIETGGRWHFQLIDLNPVIVRGPHDADCNRLQAMSSLGQAHGSECAEQTRKGWNV